MKAITHLPQSQDRPWRQILLLYEMTIAPQAGDHCNSLMMITYIYWDDSFMFIVWKHHKKWFLTFKFSKDQKRMKILFSEGTGKCNFIFYWWYEIFGKQFASINKNFQGTNPFTKKFRFRNLAFWYTQSLQRIFIEILFMPVKLKEMPPKFWFYLNWCYQIAP